MNNPQFGEQHSNLGDTAIMSTGPAAKHSDNVEHMHWSVADLVLLTISSIVAFVGILVVFTIVLTSIYGREHLQDITMSPTYSIGAAVIEVISLFGVVYLLGIVRKHLSWSSLGFHRLTRRWTWGALGMSLLLIPLGTLASYAVIYLFKLPATNPQLPFLAPKGTTWVSIGVLLVLTGIFIPFAEELFFRGVLFSFLRERWNFWVAAIVSALVFAVVHADLIVGATAFVLGLFSAFAYERSKSLWASIIVHTVSNTLKLLFIYAFVAATLKIPLF